MRRFQATATIPVFLLTSQVGGLGLTLTAADRVIVVDPSWNPSTDNQAVDRFAPSWTLIALSAPTYSAQRDVPPRGFVLINNFKAPSIGFCSALPRMPCRWLCLDAPGDDDHLMAGRTE